MMRIRALGSLAYTLVLFGLTASVFAAPASQCAVKDTAPESAHILAKTDLESNWQEYRTVQEIPALNMNGGMSAEFWREKGRGFTVYIVEPAQDVWVSTRYCFDGSGNLQALGFEVRTSLGWGHRAEGFVSGGGFDASSSEFFDLRNGKTVQRPDGVTAMPRALKPVLYMKQSDLPFASMLEPPAGSQKKHAKRESDASNTASR